MVTELQLDIGGDTVVPMVARSTNDPLGILTWYGCREQTIPFDELEEKLAAADVPRELWPSRTRPSDALKAAVRDVQGRDYLVEYDSYEDAAGKRKTDPRTMLIVERLHDQGKDALPVAMKVRFVEHRGGYAYLHFERSSGFDAAKEGELEARIRAQYEVYRNSFKADDIRQMIVRALHGAYAVMVKRAGGVYFVLDKHTPGIEAVARVVEDLPGAEMVAVTVVDRESERKTMLKRYEKATLERIEELMLQVQEINTKAEPIVPSTMSRVVEELEYLREQKAQYEQVLAVAMGKVDVEMQVLENETSKLATLVKTKAP